VLTEKKSSDIERKHLFFEIVMFYKIYGGSDKCKSVIFIEE